MSSCITNFNHICNETERVLSWAAKTPVIGILPAGCKLVLGTIQAIAALALGILSAPFRCCSDDTVAFNDHCWSHVMHGLGNVVASIGEAIPLLGYFLYLNRSRGHNYENTHQDKYIPYPDLIERDVALNGKSFSYSDGYAPPLLSPTRFRALIEINVVSDVYIDPGLYL